MHSQTARGGREGWPSPPSTWAADALFHAVAELLVLYRELPQLGLGRFRGEFWIFEQNNE